LVVQVIGIGIEVDALPLNGAQEALDEGIVSSRRLERSVPEHIAERYSSRQRFF
jgi:hypothetical protein